MEIKKIKNTIGRESSMPSVATVLALMALGCVCAIYWPVFAKFNSGGAVADPTVYPLTVIYGVLFSAMLFYVIFTGALVKKTLILSGLFSIPIFLYYFIEKIGVLEYIVFHADKDLFFVYESNPVYYSGENLFWIVMASLFSLFAMFSFVSLCFHKIKFRIFNIIVVVTAFCVRTYFSIYHLQHNEFVLYHNGTYALSDITYAVLGHLAGVLFFASAVILVLAMRKTEYIPKHASKKAAGSEEIAVVQPEPNVLAAPEQAQAEPMSIFDRTTEMAGEAAPYDPISGETYDPTVSDEELIHGGETERLPETAWAESSEVTDAAPTPDIELKEIAKTKKSDSGAKKSKSGVKKAAKPAKKSASESPSKAKTKKPKTDSDSGEQKSSRAKSDNLPEEDKEPIKNTRKNAKKAIISEDTSAN
ncbi:MAG: hypothetical protein RRZ42_02885 [Oscillospiraceae bacterium]